MKINLRHALLGATAAIAAVLATTGAPGTPAANATPPNTNPAFVVAYSVNVENLVGQAGKPATCRRAYQRLVDYMAAQPLAPDFVLVQQVSDQANLDKLVNLLATRTGRPYAGILAVPNPRPMGGGGCRASTGAGTDSVDMTTDQKKQQTNAIIYRTGRFNLQGAKHTWKSDAQFVANGPCINAATEVANQDRTINVAARFKDDQSGSFVTAASFHWPTSKVGTGDTMACAPANISELVSHTSDATLGGSALKISGGDANIAGVDGAGTSYPWYASALGSYGLKDPVRDRCVALGLTATTCESTNWTAPSHARRIDFLLGGSASSTTTGATVPFEAMGPLTSVQDQYSDHRAVQGYFYY
ncbi:hypothetical protein ACFJIY_09150 [Pimelobacter simplex]|uniref:hypothetical protein n=1 Tax=Nocardioides simplex TaxID=2045 RepID=UPI00366D9614